MGELSKIDLSFRLAQPRRWYAFGIVLVCLILTSCVTAIDQRLPYTQLPEIEVANPTKLIASPAHPTSFLDMDSLRAGERVRVIGANSNAEWLLVLHGAEFGWMHTLFSRSNIGTLKPALKVEPLPGNCTAYLGSISQLEEWWPGGVQGSVIVLGGIYRPQVDTSFSGAKLTLAVRGGSRDIKGNYIHTLLTDSEALVLFAFHVEDITRSSRLHFELADAGPEPLVFLASFFRNDCQQNPHAATMPFAERLPIGLQRKDVGVPAWQPGGALTPPPSSATPRTTQPSPTPVVIKVTSGPPRLCTPIRAARLKIGGVAFVSTDSKVNVRDEPGTNQRIRLQLQPPAQVTVLAGPQCAEGMLWWKLRIAGGDEGWASEANTEEYLLAPFTGELPATPKPRSTSAPVVIASNRGNLQQGQNGWTYQYEEGRDSGFFAPFTNRQLYGGVDCYLSPREDYVRLCVNGEVHPGQQSRVAYRWDSTYNGQVTVAVHAHKIDTRCGDGVWVGTFFGERNQAPQPLGNFSIGGSDNNGHTDRYVVHLSTNTYLLVVVAIRSQAECDQTRIFVDISP